MKNAGNDVVIFRQNSADVLELLKAGKITPAAANAFSSVSGKILQSVRLEMEFNRMIGAAPNIGFLSNKSNSQPKTLGKQHAIEKR